MRQRQHVPPGKGAAQGNYRIIYEVQDTQLVVIVIKVGHRREVYSEQMPQALTKDVLQLGEIPAMLLLLTSVLTAASAMASGEAKTGFI